MCENVVVERNEVPDLERGEDVVDILNRKAGQLFAMLAMIHGQGLANFQAYSDTIKDDYLFACSDLADQIKILSGHVH